MKFLTNFFAFTAMLFLLSSCDTKPSGSTSTEVKSSTSEKKTVDATAVTEPVINTFEGCPSKVTVKKGESFKIILSGNPSTGFTWAVNPLNYKLLQFVKVYPEETPSNSEPKVGAPQRMGFEFKALDVATTEITFEYKRTFEKVPAAEKCTVQVVVQ